MQNLLTGRLIAAARALTGISLEELANASGIAPETLHLLESNGAAWIPINLQKLSATLWRNVVS